MSNYTVEVLEDVAFELREIYEYIRMDNETAAGRIYKEIKQAMADLIHFPSKGSSVDKSDKIVRDYKFIMVKPYLIFYKINGDRITVYHILDGKMDYIKILKS